MMAATNGNALTVKNAGYVMGMDSPDVKGNYAPSFLWAVDFQAVYRCQLIIAYFASIFS